MISKPSMDWSELELYQLGLYQPIGTTRGASRPRLAVRALLEQPQSRSLLDSNDLSDLEDDGGGEHAPASLVEPINHPIANNLTSISESTNNTLQANLVINHQYETNDYFDAPVYRYDKDQVNFQDQQFYNDSDSNYATHSHASIFLNNNNHSSSLTNFSSTLNSVDSTNFNQNNFNQKFLCLQI